MKYLLDTHAVIWLLSAEEEKLPKQLRESLFYCEDDFYISEITLIEIIQLQQRQRIKFQNRPRSSRATIEDNNIKILPVSNDILERFYDLPIPSINGTQHADPFDRIIISTAITRDMSLISADGKFPWYQQHCALTLFPL